MSIGGPIEEISINGRTFAVAADADSSRKLGGYENEYQANGNGTGRVVKTRVGWQLSDITVDTDDTRGDAEFLQGIADGSAYVPVAITYVSGAVYQGRGIITGEMTTSSMNTTTGLTLQGPGKLTPQQ